MLNFSVQYEVPFDELSRQQLRAWAIRAIKKAHELVDFDSAQITLRFVDEKEATELNKNYRKKDYTPNILTFDYGIDEQNKLSADIVICKSILLKEAKEQGKTVLQHACHLVTHGVLHACGFDHINDKDAEEMESIEAEIVQKSGFPHPYL